VSSLLHFSAAHYIGYVEDEETPEMIMAKFEHLARLEREQQHQQPPVEYSKTSMPINAPDTKMTSSSTLSEEQLQQLFVETSTFAMHNVVANQLPDGTQDFFQADEEFMDLGGDPLLDDDDEEWGFGKIRKKKKKKKARKAARKKIARKLKLPRALRKKLTPEERKKLRDEARRLRQVSRGVRGVRRPMNVQMRKRYVSAGVNQHNGACLCVCVCVCVLMEITLVFLIQMACHVVLLLVTTLPLALHKWRMLHRSIVLISMCQIHYRLHGANRSPFETEVRAQYPNLNSSNTMFCHSLCNHLVIQSHVY
jgi:hypothetical protein